MNIEERNIQYNKYIESKIPKTKAFPSLFNAYWVGGVVCCIGQLLKDGFLTFFLNMSNSEATTWSLIILIFLASFLTSIGVFDRIGEYAGAGTIVPITGFSNSITSPALEFKKEGFIFGLNAKMFIVAGPVIVNGIAISVIIGIIYLIIGV